MHRFLKDYRRLSHTSNSCTKGFLPLFSRRLGRGQRNPSCWFSPHCETAIAMGILIAVLVTVLLGMLIEKDKEAGRNRNLSTTRFGKELKCCLFVTNSSFMTSPFLLVVFPASNSRAIINSKRQSDGGVGWWSWARLRAAGRVWVCASAMECEWVCGEEEVNELGAVIAAKMLGGNNCGREGSLCTMNVLLIS